MNNSGSTYKFDLPKRDKSIIKVIGVGGGGSNAVNHMFRLGIKDVDFIVCNTDLQALRSSPVPIKLQIGTNLTEGLGCGAKPEVGSAAAVESIEQIRDSLTDTKMLFITAGLGGGTGTGAAPIIAKIAKEMDILTVGIVTMPFAFEGPKKYAQAKTGLDELKANCDTVLVILNTRLYEMFGNLPISQAFNEADSVLTVAAKGIAEIITLSGYVNVDFQDVRTVMHEAGAALMGSSQTSGEDRAIRAAMQAISSPLLDNRDIIGAKRILLSIISGEDAELRMDELSEITNYIQEQSGEGCEVIFGHGIDSAMGNSIRVTIIATGFVHDQKKELNLNEGKVVHDLEKSNSINHLEIDSGVVNDKSLEVEIVNKNSRNRTDDEFNDEFEKSKEFTQEEKFANNGVSIEPKAEELPKLSDDNKQGQKEDTTGSQEPDGLLLKGKEYILDLFDKSPIINNNTEEDVPMEFEDEYTFGNDIIADQVINSEGMIELNKAKERLQMEAQKRRELLKGGSKHEMSKEEYNDKWQNPAYIRRGIKLESTTHSSNRFISKYNLNENNNLSGGNRFLHDNVD